MRDLSLEKEIADLREARDFCRHQSEIATDADTARFWDGLSRDCANDLAQLGVPA